MIINNILYVEPMECPPVDKQQVPFVLINTIH